MKFSKQTIIAFVLILLVASLYRVWEGRPFGFAPQMAIALFAGAVIKDKKWAIILPLLSMLLSDVLYQVLYVNGMTPIQGFYDGQWVNYLLIAGITVFGMLMRRITFLNVLGFSVSGSVIYFLLSNFAVWIGGGGLGRPKTFDGLMLCYGDAIAFYRDYGVINGFAGNVLIGDLFFAGLLFGTYYIATQLVVRPVVSRA
jgi:hypothetical protein